MTTSEHPSLAAVLDGSSPTVVAHVAHCASCRRLAALADDPGGDDGETLIRGTLLDDRFEIEHWVVSGGMGAIYRARDRLSGVAVAIKVATRRDPISFARFEREACLLAELAHPTLVEYIAHHISSTGTSFLAMRWLDGVDLASHLQSASGASPHRTTLPIDDVIRLGARLATGVEVLHARGVLHRDIKPSNVFLVGGDVADAKLIDLGAAREAVDPRPLTALGTVVGTAYYMAPEQVRAGDVGPAADLWAIGCVLYECLTGQLAFGASQPLAAMTRVLIDEPLDVGQLRADCPRELAELVHALLSKEPARRPSATELRARLELVHAPRGIAVPTSHIADGSSRSPAMPRERFLRTFLFARARPGKELAGLGIVAAYGGHVALLAAGTGAALITFEQPTESKDEATRAAQLALALRQASSDLVLVLASGNDSTGQATPVPAMVDRAITTLLAADVGDIRLDRTTARLVGDRFAIADHGDSYRLLAEHALDDRPGVMSPMVGRQRELDMLLATLDECIESRVARAVLVTAPAGQGKSRLRQELLRELAHRGTDICVLVARGEPLSAGSPFVMLAPALRRLMGIDANDAADVMRRKLTAQVARSQRDDTGSETTAFLGEILEVPFSDDQLPALRAARSEPALMTQRTRAALCSFIAGLAREQPILVVLDDLHWGDHPSVVHVEALLRDVEHVPLMVLALARPEVDTMFPGLWRTCEIEQLRLRPLTAKASGELARHVLGAAARDDQVESLVVRSEGNPFFLEELLHATLAGDVEVPTSLLAVIQSRVRALPEQLRASLLAASVFGEVFCPTGVDVVRGVVTADDRWVSELARRELIVVETISPVAGRNAYRFRHSLLRDAAYAMLAEPDVALAHGRAAAWLVAAGSRDAVVLAGHFAAAAQADVAVGYYLQAAREALSANDMTAATARAEHAIRAGAAGQVLGQLRAIQAEAAYWSGRHTDVLHACEDASALLDEGTPAWYRAIGLGIGSAARLNQFAARQALYERAAHAAGSNSERTICLARAAYQLVWEGRLAEADATLALIGDPDAFDLLTRAQVHDAVSHRHYGIGDMGPSFAMIRDALAAYTAAGDVNNVILSRMTLAWGDVRCGRHRHTIATLRPLVAESAGRGFVEVITSMTLGFALLDGHRAVEEAEALFRAAETFYEAAGIVRYHGWAKTFVAWCALERGDWVTAYREANRASTLLSDIPILLGHPLAVEAQALFALGRQDEALARACLAFAVTDRLGGQMSRELLPGLIAAELHDATGNRAAARLVVERTQAQIVARVARFVDDDLRASYLARSECTRIAQLAAAWAL